MELPVSSLPPGLGRRQARQATHAKRASPFPLTASIGFCSTPRPICARKSRRTESLHPRGEARGSPIAAVVLTGAEIDQTAGLLSLRERSPFTLCATAATLAAIADNPMFAALAPDVVARRAVVPGERFALGMASRRSCSSCPARCRFISKATIPTPQAKAPPMSASRFLAATARLAYVPGAAALTPAVMQRLARADVVFFDGTLFSDDEMIASGTGTKTGRRMGHMPIDGPDGSLAALNGLRARRIFVHINNTNPILIEGSPERARVEAAGWEVAEDGMEVAL